MMTNYASVSKDIPNNIKKMRKDIKWLFVLQIMEVAQLDNMDRIVKNVTQVVIPAPALITIIVYHVDLI